jgi:hypothetical protein
VQYGIKLLLFNSLREAQPVFGTITCQMPFQLDAASCAAQL